MDDEIKISLARIISLVLFLGLGILFFIISNNIEVFGKPVVDFCHDHYRNESFLSTMTREGDTYKLNQCNQTWHKFYFISYCNSTCYKDYTTCLNEKATEDQLTFMDDCHWMGADYLIIAGNIGFKVLAMGMLMLIIAEIITIIREAKGVKEETNVN